jgi:HEAT repeat protein
MYLRYKWIILPVLIMLFTCAMAQDVRTLKTRTADILARMPAENREQAQLIYSELADLGEEGLKAVCAMLEPTMSGQDTPVRYGLNGLCHYVCQPGKEMERTMVNRVLAEVLKTTQDKDIQAFLISQIQIVGQENSVKILAPYLKDEKLCDPAVRALLTIGTSQAEKALLKALGNATDKTLPFLVQALGEMKSRAATKKLIQIADNKEGTLRSLALWALANTGDPRSRKTLSSLPVISTPQERQEAPILMLLYAERLAEDGHTRQAVDLSRDLIRTRTASDENQIPCSALGLLSTILGEGVHADLLKAADNDQRALVGKALDLAETIPGENVTRLWMEKLGQVPDWTRAGIIHMLGRRGDKVALPVLLELVQDTVPEVRHAAIEASARMARNDAVPLLLKVLRQNRSEDVPVIKSAILSFTDKKAIPALGDVVTEMPPSARIALMDVLAQRRAKDYLQTIWNQTEDKNVPVRLAAMKSLKPLVSENDLSRCIDLLLKKSNGDSEIAASGEAVVSAASQIPDAETRSDAVLSRLKKTVSRGQIRLLALLPEIGGKKALETVVQKTRTVDTVVRDAASKALSDWRDFQAAEPLLSMGEKAKKTEHRVQALTGYIRLVNQEAMESSLKIDMLKKAMDAAERDDERRKVLSGLGSIPSKASLFYVGSFLDDSGIGNDAAVVVARIACPGGASEKGLLDRDVIPVIKKAISAVEDPYVKKQMETHLGTLSQPGEALNQPPDGFIALFNGKDLIGWKGLAGEGGNPLSRMNMSDEELMKAQMEADASMHIHWKVEDGILVFDGKGSHLCTAKDYGDFEMLVDWKIGPGGDSGIYLRGSPQVQIWDPAQWPEGSGGLYNNQKNPSKPLKFADNPVGSWNNFRILMVGERVTVYLNDMLVVNDVVMENYWDRNQSIFPIGQIELQSHGSSLYFKNVFIREIVRSDEWDVLFNGRDFTGWMGATDSYRVEDGKIVSPRNGGGNLYIQEQFSDFILQFEFKLTPGANNGLGIRTPAQGDAAYVGMELQILDNTAAIYKDLEPYQYHGSIYGVVPAKRGHLKPVGEWNVEEVTARGSHVKVTLNGVPIVDADIKEASTPRTIDGNDHPGLLREKGHISFCGHNSRVEFRNIRIKRLK